MDEGSQSSIIDLEAGSEWRFELENEEDIAVRVLTRDPVFVNSEELSHEVWYPLYRNLKASVYSPTASQIEVSSLPASQYSSSSTTQPQLISLHLALERTRLLARRYLRSTNNTTAGQSSTVVNSDHQGVTQGPRVMVVGPASSGKTSVVKALTNMALGTGMGWTPGVIGLDPASPSNLIPGSLSLSTPQFPIPTHHPANPLGSPPTSDPLATMASDVPTLGWWYGHLEPTTRGVEVWRKLVTNMASRWADRCTRDPTANMSGLIMDTSSAFANPTLGTRKDDPKARYSLVAQAVQEFQIDTILVLSHEKLSIDLSRLFPQLTVLRLPKSGGAVDLDEHYNTLLQAFQIRSYFYGEPRIPASLSSLPGKLVGMAGQLTPYSFQIGWETLTVVRVGEENAAPSSALPLGSARVLSPTRLTRVDPSGPAHVHRLMNAVLAIVHILPGDKIVKEKEDAKATGTGSGIGAVKEEVKEEKPAGEEGGGDIKPDVNPDGSVIEAKEEVNGKGEDENGDGMVVEEEDMDDEVPYIEDVGTREIAGFIVITGIDPQRRKYTVLSPSPGKLPSTVALAGSIEWVDSE